VIEERDLFERAVQRFAPTDDAFERLLSRRDRKRRNQRIAAGAVGLAAALAVALTGASLLRSEPIPGDRTPVLRPVRNGEIVMARGLFWDPETNPELIAVDPGTGAVRRLVTCDQECGFATDAWSPSGTELLYGSGGSLYALDMEKGSSRAVVSGRSGNGIFSPNGKQIVYEAGMPPQIPTEFFLTRADGSGARELEPLAGLNLWWYQWSPDGRSIAYLEHSVYQSDGSIRVLDLDGPPTARTLVSFPRADPCNPPWAPLGCVHSVSMSPVDGRIAYATFDPERGSDSIRVVDQDDGDIRLVARLTATGEPGFSPNRLAWSPDGSRIAYAAGCQIWSMAPDGTDQTLIKDLGSCTAIPTAIPDRLTWSPDGTELSFFELDRAVGGALRDVTLTVLTVDGGAVRRLATFGVDDAVGLQAFAWRPLPVPQR
jgi:Tol biopolymer transport system component